MSEQSSSDTDRDPEEQLRIDLLNAFYQAFKNDVDPTAAQEHAEATMQMAADDAGVDVEGGDLDA